MGRHPLLLHPRAPGHLVEVAEKWPNKPAAADGCAQAASADAAAALAAYRRHRQRLADVFGPGPACGSRFAAHSEPVDLFPPEVLEAATALYDPGLPYHNAGHALRAVACGERLLRVCARTGVRVDATVVRLALLFHDAGYGTDPSTVGCSDPEAYAAWLARRTLANRVPAPVLDAVKAAILATRRTARPDTPEGKVVRAADLTDLAADYETFSANSEALRVEHEQLTGSHLSAEDWGKAVDHLLSDYLAEQLWPLELLDVVAGDLGFHATAKANLSRYLDQLR